MAVVATIVVRGGIVDGATVSVDSVRAALDVTGAVAAIEVLDGAVDDGRIVGASCGLSVIALPSPRALRSSTIVNTAKASAVAARSLVQRGSGALGRGAAIAD